MMHPQAPGFNSADKDSEWCRPQLVCAACSTLFQQWTGELRFHLHACCSQHGDALCWWSHSHLYSYRVRRSLIAQMCAALREATLALVIGPCSLVQVSTLSSSTRHSSSSPLGCGAPSSFRIHMPGISPGHSAFLVAQARGTHCVSILLVPHRATSRML